MLCCTLVKVHCATKGHPFWVGYQNTPVQTKTYSTTGTTCAHVYVYCLATHTFSCIAVHSFRQPILKIGINCNVQKNAVIIIINFFLQRYIVVHCSTGVFWPSVECHLKLKCATVYSKHAGGLKESLQVKYTFSNAIKNKAGCILMPSKKTGKHVLCTCVMPWSSVHLPFTMKCTKHEFCILLQ